MPASDRFRIIGVKQVSDQITCLVSDRCQGSVGWVSHRSDSLSSGVLQHRVREVVSGSCESREFQSLAQSVAAGDIATRRLNLQIRKHFYDPDATYSALVRG